MTEASEAEDNPVGVAKQEAGSMATTHRQPEASRPAMIERLFVEHPRSLGMSWATHGIGAMAIGARLIGAGAACIVHALVPGWFTRTAGKTITGMYDHMMKRKADAANPESWPEYEI